jgi:hypothetical protein
MISMIVSVIIATASAAPAVHKVSIGTAIAADIISPIMFGNSHSQDGDRWRSTGGRIWVYYLDNVSIISGVLLSRWLAK